MIQVCLPDGSKRQFSQPITVAEFAQSIGPGLAKAALAGKVDGELVDTSFLLDHDASVAIVTAKDPEGLELIRHSTAHLLAYAVKALYPEAQVTIGPVIEHGFYYDFSYDRPFTPEDLNAIEARMHELAARDELVTREDWKRDDAVAFFRAQGEHYKAEIIESIPADQTISLYREGDFVDLCRGPHVPSTGKLKVFKLMKVAGAYWRGDHRNAMLQRIYGTAWATQADQDAYLHMLAEAEKRDHRRLGQELDLFSFPEEIGSGLAVFHPKGGIVRRAMEDYSRKRHEEEDYEFVYSPHLTKAALFQKSGHLDWYSEGMYPPMIMDEELHADGTIKRAGQQYYMKPMNCPFHNLIFQSRQR
ncbi:MAG: TGS domain-containing protein, partial [Betaproteobacteria bacterium]|nr:TGS domain-containing protein [Betaproteobacteria bacterium]